MMIISGNVTSFIQEFLKNYEIDFISQVLGGDIEKSKIKKINLFKEKFPGYKVYYIGDTVGDIKEAKHAGVLSVAVTWGFHNKKILEKENPEYLFTRPEELLKLI